MPYQGYAVPAGAGVDVPAHPPQGGEECGRHHLHRDHGFPEVRRSARCIEESSVFARAAHAVEHHDLGWI
ncbi:MAG TPA: hypothetical protein VFD59_05870 [Nocardioidaceae bacterium]|nr:hypothetical protein [Nocardioidaceae bacterium]